MCDFRDWILERKPHRLLEEMNGCVELVVSVNVTLELSISTVAKVESTVLVMMISDSFL